MMTQHRHLLSRRDLVAATAAGAALAFAARPGLALASPRPTPFQTVGPFYPQVKPLDQDGDLTAIAGRATRARGEIIHVAGRVLDSRGRPVSGARVELWQANADGRYAHPSEPDNGRPIDPNFQGFGFQMTDADGRYHFKTVKPGAYPIGDRLPERTPHIHFDVHGRSDRLITQMYFPGEPLNGPDIVFKDVEDKESVIARLQPGANAGAKTMLWDIVLQSG